MNGSTAGGRLEIWLFILQRLSALVLAPLVLVHLITLILAVHGDLSVEAILSRTRGNIGMAAFYGLFICAAAVHGAIGLRTIAREMLGWRGAGLNAAALLFVTFVLLLGWRAVEALV